MNTHRMNNYITLHIYSTCLALLSGWVSRLVTRYADNLIQSSSIINRSGVKLSSFLRDKMIHVVDVLFLLLRVDWVRCWDDIYLYIYEHPTIGSPRIRINYYDYSITSDVKLERRKPKASCHWKMYKSPTILTYAMFWKLNGHHLLPGP